MKAESRQIPQRLAARLKFVLLASQTERFSHKKCSQCLQHAVSATKQIKSEKRNRIAHETLDNSIRLATTNILV